MNKLKLLFLEDSTHDVFLIQRTLRQSGIEFDPVVVSNETDFRAALQCPDYDAILLDNKLPLFDAEKALEIIKEKKITIPSILVTGSASESLAVQMIHDGAWDCVSKDRLFLLPGTLLNAIDKHQLEIKYQKKIDDLLKKESLMKETERLAHIGSWENNLLEQQYYWSDEYYRILGYEVGEVAPSKDHLLARVHPDDIDYVNQQMRNAKAGTNSAKYAYRIIPGKGGTKYLESEVFITRNELKEITRINGFTKDITESKLAEQALLKTEKKYHNLFENNPIPMWVMEEVSLRFLDVNNAAIQHYGYTRDEFLNMNVLDIRSASEKERFLKEEKIFNGSGDMGLWEHRKKDGANIVVQVTIDKIFFDDRKCTLVLANDVTSKTAAEKKLQHTMLRLEQAQGIAHIGSWDLDLSTGVSIWSDEACKIYGLTPCDSSQSYKSWLSFIHPDDANLVVSQIAESNATLTGSDFYHRIVRRDGTIRHIHSQYEFEVIAGKPVGLFGISHDVTDAKEAEDKLRHTTLRLHQAQGIAHVGSWELDIASGIGLWSEEACRMYGLDVDDNRHSHASWLSFVHPEDIYLVNEKIAESNTNQKGSDFSTRVIHKDGSVRHVHVQYEFELIDGKPVAIFGTIHDITKAKEIENRLRHTTLRLQQAQAIAHIGSWEHDLRTDKLIWSDEANRIYGLNPAHGIKTFQDWRKFIYPEDNELVDTWIKKSADSLSSTPCNYRIIRLDGAIRHIYAQFEHELDNNGKAIGRYGIMHDITEMKEAELALIQSEANLRLIMDSIPQSISVRNLAGEFVFVNKRLAELYGTSPEKLIGQSIRSVIPKENNDEEFVNRDREIIRTGQVKILPELHFIDSKGYNRIFHITKMPYTLPGKNEKAILGIGTDITEQKQAEAERMKMMSDLIQRNKDLEQFSYIVSHSLRSPVANILGITDLVKNHDLSADELSFLLDGLTESVKKLDNVVMDLNEITQLSHTISEFKEEVKFSDLLVDVKNSIGNLMNKYDVSINGDFHEVTTFHTVHKYMHSIFHNLITNSIKHKKAGSALVCDIRSKKVNKHIELSFADNGRGLDLTKTGDQVFDLYKRYHIGTQSNKSMGLFMVKAQVEDLGGQISVTSEVDKGTEFKIVLPLLDAVA